MASCPVNLDGLTQGWPLLMIHFMTKLTMAPIATSIALQQLLDGLPVHEVSFVGLRRVLEASHRLSSRNGQPDGHLTRQEAGVMVEVAVGKGFAYCGTADLSPHGIRRAYEKAKAAALSTANHQLWPFQAQARPVVRGEYQTQVQIKFSQADLKELIEFLVRSTQTLMVSPEIVTAQADLTALESEIEYVTSLGTHTQQSFSLIHSHFAATAQRGPEIQTRSLGGPRGLTKQGGIEALYSFVSDEALKKTSQEALALLSAENCPTGTFDAILMPDQMYIQIHESIGHPLELDRILGDERNYAGWSFVKPDDFGKLQYGSHALNVSFDPGVKGEFASYAFDDGGLAAEKQWLIKDGVLQRGLGGMESQLRLGIPGVSNFRSANWNRAPIDRMANINVEPGTETLESMVSLIEEGFILESNISWSIDDYRNKFQFGCELAHRVKNGKIIGIVKNPNYRDSTLSFWSKLQKVGRAQDSGVQGSPYCGKGEPSQVIRVGHSSPPCLFKGLQIFGGG
jgi:predicted Zn-dependent protease